MSDETEFWSWWLIGWAGVNTCAVYTTSILQFVACLILAFYLGRFAGRWVGR